MNLLRLLATLPCVLPFAAARGDEELERWVRALDSAREPEWTAALERLSTLGAAASERVLSDFERVDFTARRARAKLLVQIPAPEQCARVLALLGDPDPQVRRLLALLLGNPALGATSAKERVQALERAALEDANDHVRAKAREALVDCALVEAVPALDRLVGELPAEEAEKAAAALAQLPAARERLIARVVGAFAHAGRPGDGVLAALLRGYGRALAEVPRGGEERRERLPLLQGRSHPSPAVQTAARAALGAFVARSAELAEAGRADRVLAALAHEGWPAEECLRRRLDIAWLEEGDPAAGLALARELGQRAQALAPDMAEAWERHARFLEGAALYALDEGAQAGALFGELCARLEAGRARRGDLFPTPRALEPTQRDHEPSRGGGAVLADQLELAALAHLWQALLAVDGGARDARVPGELRAAHRLFLEARGAAMRTEAADPAVLDALFEHDLSPYALVLFNDELGPERRGPALDLAVALGRAWGSVAPLEMLGFEGGDAVERELADLFLDTPRLEALRALRTAHEQQLVRAMIRLREDEELFPYRERNDRRSQLLGFRLEELQDAESAERAALQGVDPRSLSGADLRTIHAQLCEYLTPSMHAHTLAGELRAEGRAAEARALCERALETLRTAPVGASPVWAEWASARFELMRGSTFMDEGRAGEAETACLEAVRRLEAIEAALEERRAPADPDEERQREGQLRTIREMRGDALLSLAVNANVRMGEPGRALEYFERAYALNQSPFMRVLRACYRARSGKAEEARVVLQGVVPVPSLYYNIACTHALLGEVGLALDFLERDFRENYPSEGARARQREWARKDPDLARLRGEPRFERLLGGGN